MNKYTAYSLVLMILAVTHPASAENIIPFEGQLDLAKNEINVTLNITEESSVSASARKISKTDYQFSFDIEHWKTPFFDLLSKIESSVEVVGDRGADFRSLADMTYKGNIRSQHSLVDYKPVKDLSGDFEIKEQRLYLENVAFGDIRINGYLDLVQPYKLNLSLDLTGVAMGDFLNFWGANNQYESAGIVTGIIKASGTFDNLFLKGSLESRNGFVEKLDYDVIALNAEGTYPDMQIAQSTISKSDGVSFTFDGPFNLSDRKNFKKQIKSLSLAPLVSDSGTEREWTIKRLNQEESEVTEIKYRHRTGDALSIGTSAQDESDMFGFEQTRKF